MHLIGQIEFKAKAQLCNESAVVESPSFTGNREAVEPGPPICRGPASESGGARFRLAKARADAPKRFGAKAVRLSRQPLDFPALQRVHGADNRQRTMIDEFR